MIINKKTSVFNVFQNNITDQKSYRVPRNTNYPWFLGFQFWFYVWVGWPKREPRYPKSRVSDFRHSGLTQTPYFRSGWGFIIRNPANQTRKVTWMNQSLTTAQQRNHPNDEGRNRRVIFRKTRDFRIQFDEQRSILFQNQTPKFNHKTRIQPTKTIIELLLKHINEIIKVFFYQFQFPILKGSDFR